MKRKLLVLTAFALCLALLCGCTTIATSEWMQNLFPVGDEAVAAQQTGSVDGSDKQQEVKQVVTETYTALESFGLAYQPDYGLQPYNCQSLNNRIIFSFLYEPLFAVTSSYEAEPVLAETYFVTDDGRTTTVKLRSGVTFHDGSALTASDVVKSFNVAKSSQSSPYNSQLAGFTRFEAASELIFVAHLSEADIDAASFLDLPILKEGSQLTGCGLYMFSQYNGETVLVKNPEYFKEAKVERIKLRSAVSEQQMQNLFLVGELDMLIVDKSIDSTLISSRDYDIINYSSSTMVFLGINSTRPNLTESSVRKALSDCIDRAYLRDQTMVGRADATVYPFSPQWYRLDGIEPLPVADTTAAAEQLKQIGELNLIVTDGSNVLKEVAERAAEFIRDAGAQVNITVLDSESYHAAIAAGEYDLYLGQTKLARDMDSTFLFSTGRALNLQSAASDELDQAYQSYKSGDITLMEYCNAWRELTPIIPLFFQKHALFVTKGVAGISSNSSYSVYGDFTGITLS